jgi:hypothetical protein
MPVAGKDKESILGLGCASISRAPAWKVKDPEFILSPSTTVPPKKKERKKEMNKAGAGTQLAV